MGTHVWGAGGSRKGRRVSMDNPVMSTWMKTSTNADSGNNGYTAIRRPTNPVEPPTGSINSESARSTAAAIASATLFQVILFVSV